MVLGDDGKNMSEDAKNFALNVICAVEPKDELPYGLQTNFARNKVTAPN